MFHKFNESFVVIGCNMFESTQDLYGKDSNAWSIFTLTIKNQIDFSKKEFFPSLLKNFGIIDADYRNLYSKYK
ncbi:hypothetical protein bcgnr5406_30950 [Bacillus cereus]